MLWSKPKGLRTPQAERKRGMKLNNISEGTKGGCLLFLLSLAYLWPFCRVLRRVGDEGILVYGAQLVTEGALPYRDFFDVCGPGSWYWLALFFKLFGNQFVVARGVLMLTGAVITVLIYWMTRRLYKGPFDMLPALFSLIMGIPTWPAVNHHWDSNLFALIAVFAFLTWGDKGSSKYLLISGIIAGLTSCFLQQKGLFLVLAFLIVILVNGYRTREPQKQILCQIGTLLSGYVGIGFFIILVFYLAGGLNDLFYATLIFPARRYSGVNLVPYGFGLLEFYWPSWQAIFNHFFPPLASKAFGVALSIPFLLIMALPFLLAILLVSSSLGGGNRLKFYDGSSLPFWIAGLALWLSELQRKDINHLIYGSPLLLILLFVIWNKVTEEKRLLRSLGLAVVITGLLSFGTYNTFEAAAARYKFTTRRGTVYSFKEDTALKFLHDQIQRGEQVFIYPYYPLYYFLADIKNPTRYSILMYQINTEDQFNEAIACLEGKKVKYVLWDTSVDGPNMKRWFPQYDQPPEEEMRIEKYMRDHFEIIGMKSGWRILRRRSGF